MITPKQKLALAFIEKFIAHKGYGPSYKEIAEGLDLKSLGSVAQYLDSLEERGFIRRGLRSREIFISGQTESVTIPLIGIIAAGNPIEPIENPEPIEVPKSMMPRTGMVYALKIQGTSMIDDGIADGDVVIIKQQNTAENGDTVVAITEQGATLKRFYREGNGQVRLEPRSPRLRPFYPEELEIRGKFIGLIRHEPEINFDSSI